MATNASRDGREKKEIARFAPETTKAEKEGGGALYEGSGVKLGDIPVVPANLNKIDADHDLLKAFHSYLYGVVGKKTVRKKNIRSFSGFPEPDDKESRAVRVKKLESKKWTVPALKDLCTLLGLDKGGDKAVVVKRIVGFLFCPSVEASTPLKEKKKPVAAAKKRKSTGSQESDKKGKQAKKEKVARPPRPLTGFMVFSNANRDILRAKEPDLHFLEMGKRLGEMWKECSEAEKDKYKQKGIEDFEKKQAAAAAAAEDDGEDDEEEDEEE